MVEDFFSFDPSLRLLAFHYFLQVLVITWVSNWCWNETIFY